jgi:prepilin-type processing-associated H-X9-DG protein
VGVDPGAGAEYNPGAAVWAAIGCQWLAHLPAVARRGSQVSRVSVILGALVCAGAAVAIAARPAAASECVTSESELCLAEPGWHLIGQPDSGDHSLSSCQVRNNDTGETLAFCDAAGPPYQWLQRAAYAWSETRRGYVICGCDAAAYEHTMRWGKGYWVFTYLPNLTLLFGSPVPSCSTNLKQLVLAAKMYADDWDGMLPSADSWVSDLRDYLRGPSEVLRCPERPDLEVGYAMNRALSGYPEALALDPMNTPLFFESDLGGANPAGGVADVASPRHGDGNNFGFVDGHAELVIPPRDFPEFGLWDPSP